MGDSYRDLVVWQRAIQMTVAIYRLSAGFPKDEMYGLTSQLRRAAVSVASNIAEGYGRGSRGEYKQFLGMARGSICEVQTQLTIARELDYGSPETLTKAEELSYEVNKMLVTILKKLVAAGTSAG
jgi:four helix bundle protein